MWESNIPCTPQHIVSIIIFGHCTKTPRKGRYLKSDYNNQEGTRAHNEKDRRTLHNRLLRFPVAFVETTKRVPSSRCEFVENNRLL